MARYYRVSRSDWVFFMAAGLGIIFRRSSGGNPARRRVVFVATDRRTGPGHSCVAWEGTRPRTPTSTSSGTKGSSSSRCSRRAPGRSALLCQREQVQRRRDGADLRVRRTDRGCGRRRGGGVAHRHGRSGCADLHGERDESERSMVADRPRGVGDRGPVETRRRDR